MIAYVFLTPFFERRDYSRVKIPKSLFVQVNRIAALDKSMKFTDINQRLSTSKVIEVEELECGVSFPKFQSAD